jgi:hypothetical protein
MSTLLDVLLTEQLVAIFRAAMQKRQGLNVALVPDPGRDADLLGDGGTAARIETTAGESLLVTPRRIARDVGGSLSNVVLFENLVGYDWISRELSEKVRLKDQHYDRLYLHLQGAREVVLDRLGPAVHPLMAYLGKVLQLRSQKVLLRGMDDDVVELVGRCLRAAVVGPFFTDEDLVELVEQDRASLQVVSAMWQRMNLAAPELQRTVEGVMEMLLQRREEHQAAWDRLVGAPPEKVRGALDVFRRVVEGRV